MSIKSFPQRHYNDCHEESTNSSASNYPENPLSSGKHRLEVGYKDECGVLHKVWRNSWGAVNYRWTHDNTDIYFSVFRYAEKEGNLYKGPFYADIDAETFAEAKKETIKLVDLLMSDWGINEDSIRVHFSGGTGFHVLVPRGVFTNETPKNLNKIWSRFGEILKGNVDSLDMGAYNDMGLLRAPYSKNSETGLYKIGAHVRHLKDKTFPEWPREVAHKNIHICWKRTNRSKKAEKWFKYACSRENRKHQGVTYE